MNTMKYAGFAGLTAAAAALAGCGGGGEVTLDDTPAPTYRTIMARLDGGDVVAVHRDEVDGRYVYETEVERGEENWTIIVDEDGEYLGREEP